MNSCVYCAISLPSLRPREGTVKVRTEDERDVLYHLRKKGRREVQVGDDQRSSEWRCGRQSNSRLRILTACTASSLICE